MRRSTRVALALALAWASLGPAAAGEPELPSSWRTTVVGVLPIMPAGSDVFGEHTRPVADPVAAATWTDAITRLLPRDQLEVLGPDVLRDRLLRDVRRTLALAAERHDLGVERWKALQAKDALVHLDRAAALHAEALSTLVDARAAADVAFLRGVVLRELGDPARARAAFADALALDPSRRVQRGYYDAETEALIATAEQDLADRPSPLADRWPDDTLVELVERLRVDVLVLARLEADGMLRVVIWDAATRAPARTDLLATADPLAARATLDRAFAAWHTCQITSDGIVRPASPKRWFVDVSYVHHVWLEHRRTRDFLQGPGAQVGITWAASPGLEVFFRTSQQATLSDANGDLLDVFTTSRFTLGVGLAVGSRALRFSLRAGLDTQISLARIETTQDVDCKWFPKDHPLCGSIFSSEPPTVLFGFDFGMSLRWAPVRDFYFTFSAGNASYVLSPSAASELNFPLYGGIGFGLPL